LQNPAPSLRIMIIDDHPNDAAALAAELRRCGYGVHSLRVKNESDFVCSLESSFDAILARYNLPGMNARRALEILKERGVDVPLVIIITDWMEEISAIEYVRQGAADYVHKDRPGRLGITVAQAIEKRRWRAEQRWVEEILHYQGSLVESVKDAIISTDLDLKVISWNAAARQIYGWQTEEVFGKSLDDIFEPEYGDTTLAEVHKQVLEAGAWMGQVAHKCKGGSSLEISLTISQVCDAKGIPIGLAVVNRSVLKN
jgi:PAS domain S-box-containing protein